MKKLFLKLFGFRFTLICGDPLVIDRWIWLKSKLPRTNNNEKLLDIGCGSGGFTIGAGIRGYESLGVSWDQRNQRLAEDRAEILGVNNVIFEIYDVRNLDNKPQWFEKFDVCINFENIEHILNDNKLIKDITNCLKPGGRLLLTTPYYLYNPINSEDKGPFLPIENGEHVRRGYSEAMLRELFDNSGLKIEKFEYCSGFLSQKLCAMQRYISKANPTLAWVLILPFRIFPIILDPFLLSISKYPSYSICVEGFKPRFD
jgi:cyclopropane fatty-acyl-phospholipid synthase-like methyltransferase